MIDKNSRLIMKACNLAGGWAYIQTLSDKKIWVIRPGYRDTDDFEEINDMDIEDLIMIGVCKHGFEPIEMEFENLAALIEFLGDTLIKTRRAMGYPEPSSENIKELIRFASPEMVGKILDRLEKELIPNAQFEPAKNIMNDLLEKTPAVKDSPDLQERIEKLLAKCQ